MFTVIRKVVGLVSHSIAIICTIFRLMYRSWMRHLWWDDAWAALALIADAVCLACIWVDSAISSDMGPQRRIYHCFVVRITAYSVAFLTDCFRAARMSVIFSIIPVATHSTYKIHSQITYLIAVSFACMWAALVAQKITICEFHSCHMGKTVALSLLITDVIADISLVAAPLYLLKNIRLSRSKKLLVQSAFSASLVISAITVTYSILLFLNFYNTLTLMFAHIKAALSLIVCNLLVIVTFLYRVCSKDTAFDLNQSIASNGVFTTVIITPMGSCTNTPASLSLQEGMTSRQLKVQAGGKESLDEDVSVHSAEEGTE
ncbi:uncharacterized protein HD556DRAFT_1248703 [Suillus plorans]|uniref:Uncharacterized protein n=1 Tax=Suillus plorans TaxID=116603 RepID=A0A9P7ADE5_9AGAM|nr:uncharacterized protein HD556DRAFT_1248703 [Suillus plorans]KAG1786062.1 hypothetical protein HD556DRAFT_1248703 [Suillus plorans]